MAIVRATIAIIEDDEGVRTALQELLQSAGFQAMAFASAEAFLHARREADFDCLIADINLPGMTGVALLKTLGAAGEAVPAVLMTGRDDPRTAELLRHAGPVPRLHKPFSDDELFDAIRSARGA